MKKITSIIILIFLFQLGKSQDTTKRFELGSTLMTINYFNDYNRLNEDRPRFEFVNGIFFRYTKKRFGIRANASYSENYFSWNDPSSFADGGGGSSYNKDFRIGAGVQLSVLKKKEVLYTFLDFSYRNIFSKGTYYGGIWGADDASLTKTNGFDNVLGLGSKIKILKNIYISPELAYYLFAGRMNVLTTQVNSGHSYRYNTIQSNGYPVVKIHLTVKF